MTCCGATACLECAQLILTHLKACPFCHSDFKSKEVKVLPNLPLQRLLQGGELIKIVDKLDPAMKERQQKEEARRLIESQKNKLVTSMQKLAESGLLGGEADEMMLETTGIDGNQNLVSNEPLKDLFLGKRHPMIPYMSDNDTKFFIVKAQNEDYLILGAR